MPDFAYTLNKVSVEASEFTMAVTKDDKVEAVCPVCRQRLRLSRHRVGTVECPRCRDRFEADTNTLVLDDINLRKFNIKPASTITYRIQKSRKNTGLFLVCFSLGILSPFLAIVFFASSFFNNLQPDYLNVAIYLYISSCVSWLVLIFCGKRHYIDIGPTEIYSSKLNITIKYRGVNDITRYFQQIDADDRTVRQANPYLHYTDGAPIQVPQGDAQKLHISSYEGMSMDISGDYTAYMGAIDDLITSRVAMAKASPIAWS